MTKLPMQIQFFILFNYVNMVELHLLKSVGLGRIIRSAPIRNLSILRTEITGLHLVRLQRNMGARFFLNLFSFLKLSTRIIHISQIEFLAVILK